MRYYKTYPACNTRIYDAGDKLIMVIFEQGSKVPPPDMPIEQAYKYITDYDIVNIYTTTTATTA